MEDTTVIELTMQDMNEIFSHVVERVIRLIDSMLRRIEAVRIPGPITMILVGGFCQSPSLRAKIEKVYA